MPAQRSRKDPADSLPIPESRHFVTVPRRTAGATTNMWTGATDNGSLRPVTDFRHQATFIARRVSWSPDGKSIYAAVGKGEAKIVLLTHLTKAVNSFRHGDGFES
jgi:hypothetical protein